MLSVEGNPAADQVVVVPPRLAVSMRKPAGELARVPVAMMRHDAAAGQATWVRELTVPPPLGTVSRCQVSELEALMVPVKMTGVPAFVPMATQVVVDGQSIWVSAVTGLAPLSGNSAVNVPDVAPQSTSAPLVTKVLPVPTTRHLVPLGQVMEDRAEMEAPWRGSAVQATVVPSPEAAAPERMNGEAVVANPTLPVPMARQATAVGQGTWVSVEMEKA